MRNDRPDTLRDAVISRMRLARKPEAVIRALDNVSFSLGKGSVMGIIGHNGAGKSTLLRLLCGLGRPTSGSITIKGNIGSLLELGSGFHHDLTGRENLMTGGILSGLTRCEVESMQEKIIRFAELERAIDQPVRTYSSGMYARLGFAAAIHFRPDVLIIDEVLAVGDVRFQKRCLEKLESFRSEGKALILVSHDLELVRALCDDVLVLERGAVAMQGDPERAIECYHDLMRKRTERAAGLSGSAADPEPEPLTGKRMGTHEVVLAQVEVCSSARPVGEVLPGDPLSIVLRCRVRKEVDDYAVILGIYNQANIKCFETVIPSVYGRFGMSGNGTFRCGIPGLPLFPGRYFIDVGLYPPDWQYVYDYHWHMHPLTILAPAGGKGASAGIISACVQWSADERGESG